MKVFKLFMLVLAFAASTPRLIAQQSDKQRLSREQMIEAQAKHIATDLAFDDKIYDKFITTYVNYKKELWATAPKCKRKQHKMGETEEQAAQNMRNRFEQSQKVLDIREKYYKEFSKFLTQKQIEQMYDKEKKIMQRLKQRHNKGMHNKCMHKGGMHKGGMHNKCTNKGGK